MDDWIRQSLRAHERGSFPNALLTPDTARVHSAAPHSGAPTADANPGSEQTPMERDHHGEHLRPPHRELGRETVRSPRLNTSYGTLRTIDSWQYEQVMTVSGSVLPVIAQATSVAVQLPVTTVGQFFRQSQYPGALSAYLVLRSVDISPQAGTATGNIAYRFQSGSDQQRLVTLADTLASAVVARDMQRLIPDSITDSGTILLGQFIADAIGHSLAAPVLVNWSLGFSIAYLLPEGRF